MMGIYVASSWRNDYQPIVVNTLRENGHEVYDFRNPRPGEQGFAWGEIDPAWRQWTVSAFAAALTHPVAAAGYKSDMDALREAWAVVLVLPCGRSAHLEAGWAVGAGKPVWIYNPPAVISEPELMYRMVEGVTDDMSELLGAIKIKCSILSKEVTYNWLVACGAKDGIIDWFKESFPDGGSADEVIKALCKGHIQWAEWLVTIARWTGLIKGTNSDGWVYTGHYNNGLLHNEKGPAYEIVFPPDTLTVQQHWINGSLIAIK